MVSLLSTPAGLDLLGEVPPRPGEQISLLSAAPVLQEAPDVLYKATAVVHMYPLSGTYNHFSRRVYNALLVLALRVWNAMTADHRAKVLSQRRVLRFTSTVGEISKVLRATSNATDRIYDAVDNLYKLECRFDAMAEDASIWGISSRLISQHARPEKGTGEIQWEYPPDVFQLLMKPTKYAIIDLRLSNTLSSGSALALYENTHRYVSNPGHLTAKLPVEDWIRLIVTTRSAVNYFDRGKYRYFKRDVLMPAIEELNSSEICPIQVTLQETKGLRGRVTHIQFVVEHKKQLALPTETGQTGDPRIEEEMRKWGVSAPVINRFLLSYDENELWHNIRVFKEKLAKGTIREPAAAFVNQVQNNYAGYSREEGEGSGNGAAGEPAATHLVDDDVGLASRFAEMHQEFVANRVRALYGELEADQREEMENRFLEDMGTNPIIRAEYAKTGLTRKMVSSIFFHWFSKQPGVLTRPEELSLDAFRAWTLDRRAHRANGLVIGDD